jgi:hypothetical protein
MQGRTQPLVYLIGVIGNKQSAGRSSLKFELCRMPAFRSRAVNEQTINFRCKAAGAAALSQISSGGKK